MSSQIHSCLNGPKTLRLYRSRILEDTKGFQVSLKGSILRGSIPKPWERALRPLLLYQEASLWLLLSLRREEFKNFYTTPRTPPDLGINHFDLSLNALVIFLHPNPMRLSAKQHVGWSAYDASELFLRLHPLLWAQLLLWTSALTFVSMTGPCQPLSL